MAVDDYGVVDAMSSNSDGDLVLMIADHLDWEDEEYHLLALQKKLNLYLEFIQDKQYREYYDVDFSCFVIDIHFKFGWTENCKNFLKYVVEVARPLNITVRIETEQ